jgi:predicted ATP-grasp superfamily ATP-dependent carboligase
MHGRGPGRALIVDGGNSWSSLSAVRSLAEAGWTVSVGSPGAQGLSSSSRFVTGRYDVPLLDDGLKPFLEATRDGVIRSRADVVFGGGDAEVIALSLDRDSIEAIVPYPPVETVRRAFDKYELGELAQKAGLDVPDTVEAPATIESDGPIVVKSRWHWDPDLDQHSTRVEASVERGRANIQRRVDEIRALGATALLQERLDGDHLSFIAARSHDGHILGALYQQIDRRWPVGAGWTVRAHTLPMNPHLAVVVEQLLRDIEWTGLVELEFIRPADGRVCVIDFNGRFYGSMELAQKAGINFPDLWASDATGRQVCTAPPARVGVHFQRFGGDMRRANAERRGGLWHDMLETLAYAPTATHSVFRIDDLRPLSMYLKRVYSELR